MGKKVYRGTREDGTRWEKIVKWFGYKLHLIVDASYELPIMFSVTKASVPDINEAHHLLEKMEERQPEILKKAEILTGDRGYDDSKLIINCWDQHAIKPVIDIRNMWKDGESTRLLNNKQNVTYNYKGNVFCHCLSTGIEREMACGGFDKDRNTIRKLCPAKQYGMNCEGMGKCPVVNGVRIPLSEDRRIFTPIDRASYNGKENTTKEQQLNE
ncbi:transposase [Heyndrickxia coagulans]|uniref:transposase n=1 Tax=Heyndrickxia coagulans TaxID=1398 RepID=UPI002E1FFAE4|nr:transposase [Heyndrickxia coagulans]